MPKRILFLGCADGIVPSEAVHLLEARNYTVQPLPHCSPAPPHSGVPTLLLGESPVMREVRQLISRVAATDTTVLVTGETGTGKEVVAQMIHQLSGRNAAPFICVNCAAVPESLLESELFGYEKGSFTGALHAREGKLTAANGGTAFLDEIGDMSPYSQAAVLRAIETRQVEPIGGRKPRDLNIRFIAATHQDLELLIREQRFRADLFFRLNVVRIHLPPLRERIADLACLCQRFIDIFNAKFGRRARRVHKEMLDQLNGYSWPGNVRELRNLIESSFVYAGSPDDDELTLPKPFMDSLQRSAEAPAEERTQLLHALEKAQWNKSRAAKLLRWSRMTVYRKMAKYELGTPAAALAAGS